MPRRSKAQDPSTPLARSASLLFSPFRLTLRAAKVAQKHCRTKMSRKRQAIEPPDDLWRHMPKRPNGTLITGRLNSSGLARGAQESGSGMPPIQLPPELWLEILMQVTNTYPPPLSIHEFARGPSINSPRLACLELRRRLHRRSMQLKLIMSSVSHQWRDLCKPLLFESVRLTAIKQVEQLLEIFQAEARQGLVGTASSAWWVREVWYDTNFCNCLTPKTSNSLAELLKYCPRIAAFRKFGKFDCSVTDADETKGILEQIIRPPCQSEVGNSHQHGNGPRYMDWAFTHTWGFHHFLAANPALNDEMPSIRGMELRPSYMYIFEEPAASPEIAIHTPRFPSLTSLRLLGSPAFSQAARFIMPELRSLTVYSTAWDVLYEGRALIDLLQAHGKELEELELDITFFRPLPELGDLESMCPKLEKLLVPSTTFIYKDYPSLSHTTVSIIGIQGMHKLVHDKAQDKFSTQLMVFLKQFPAVKTVQDLSLKSHELRQRSVGLWNAQDALDHRIFWMSLVAGLAKAGVALVDWSGESVAGFENQKEITIMETEADDVARGLICCR